MSTYGRLVILNGVSSAGKTTLATALRDEQARAGDLWLLVGIDDILAKIPVQWLSLGLADGVGAQAHQGLAFEQMPDGLRLRIGPTARRLIDLYHQWVSDAVRAGFNVIVDDCVVDRETFEGWLRVLDGLAPTWVAVRCPPAVAEARELARGDRAVGMASTQHDTVHRHVTYAIEIDTGELTPAEAHEALRRGLGL